MAGTGKRARKTEDEKTANDPVDEMKPSKVPKVASGKNAPGGESSSHSETLKPLAAPEPPKPTEAPKPLASSPPPTLDAQSVIGAAKAGSDAVKEHVERLVPYAQQELLAFLKLETGAHGLKEPKSLLDIVPQDIKTSGEISSFREAMRYDNMLLGFQKTGLYEAGGTLFMLDPLSAVGDLTFQEFVPSFDQFEAARAMWSEQAFAASYMIQNLRRFIFNVMLPCALPSEAVATKEGDNAVRLSAPAPLIAGHASVFAWYEAMAASLASTNEQRVWKLYEAAASCPVRFRAMPSKDQMLLDSC